MSKASQDNNLIVGLRQGDKKTLRVLYKKYFEGVMRFVVGNGGNKMDAEDIFQEVLIVLFRKTLDPEWQPSGDLGGYLTGIGKNLWLKHLRSTRKLPTVPLPEKREIELDYEEEELAQRAMKERIFFEHLKNLGDGCQKILTWFFEKIPLKEIASRLNSTEAYIKKRKFQCKERLVKAIEKDMRFRQWMLSK